MEGYLGEELLDVKDTEYKDYKPKDWALTWIAMYGSIDGADHKDWVLDQVARILNGTEIVIKKATWSNGYEEFRFSLKNASSDYYDWVVDLKAGEDGPNTYSYSEGVAP